VGRVAAAVRLGWLRQSQLAEHGAAEAGKSRPLVHMEHILGLTHPSLWLSIRGIGGAAVLCAAVSNAKMKHIGALAAHNHDGDCREQYGNHDEDKKRSLGVVTRITEPCQLNDQRLRVGRRADRLPNFGSLAPGDPSARLASNSRAAKLNRVLSCTQFRASPAGLSPSTHDSTFRR
jgi:hypothetical protein